MGNRLEDQHGRHHKDDLDAQEGCLLCEELLDLRREATKQQDLTEEKLDEAYWDGHEQGRQEGYDEGFHAGMMHAYDEVEDRGDWDE